MTGRVLSFSLLFLLLSTGAIEAVLVRVATFNIENGTGAYGSDKYEALKAVIQRIDADIVGFQELRSATFNEWQTMAAEAGYPYTAISSLGPLAGGLYNGYFSRFPILSTHNVTSPPGATELSRSPFRMVVEVPGALNPLVVWNMHKKASSGNLDRFRRAVETIRIVQDMEQYRIDNPTHLEFLMLGDMNDDDQDNQTHFFFNSIPGTPPASYQLGDDIEFPVAYALFPTHRYEEAAGGMMKVDAFWEGATNRATRWRSMRQLDYLFVSEKIAVHPKGAPLGEIYYSRSDTGTEGLYKVGNPLPAETSETASDHMAVFTDFFLVAGLPDNFDVTPTHSWLTAGNLGGPFSTTNVTYTLALHQDESSITWNGSASADWLAIEPAGGTLTEGHAVDVTVSLTAQAYALPPGHHTATITIRDEATGRYHMRNVTLTVFYPPLLIISPTTPALFSGTASNALLPASISYDVSNPGVSDLQWTVDVDIPWVNLSTAGGMLSGESSDAVSISLQPETADFPAGMYAGHLTFSNLTLGLSTVIEVSLRITDRVALDDDMEQGASGWQASGLWYLASPSTSACPLSRSGSNAWHYARSDTCDYDTGSANSGDLISPEFVVPDQGVLSYWSWEQTESSDPFWDRRTVSISTNNGASWVQLYQSQNNAAAWHEVQIHLSAYAGQAARIRFRFDTVDEFANRHRGWYVDDVRVATRGSVSVADPDLLWSVEGPEGGPFSPASAAYTLSNRGGFPVTWSATNLPTWLDVSVTQATLDVQEDFPVQLMINGDVAALTAGRYVAAVFFNDGNGSNSENTIAVELVVHDQLPPDWRFEQFGVRYPDAGLQTRAGDDPDGDGYTNWEEYIARTNPNDEESFFRPIRRAAPGAATGTWAIEIEDTVPDRVYGTYGKQDLRDDTPWQLLTAEQEGNGGSLHFTFSSPDAMTHYRTGVRLP